METKVITTEKALTNHPDYAKAAAIKTVGEETIHIKNPITGKEADVVISRRGTTDEKLAMIMLAPDATREQKDSMLSQMLFERGKESSSFITELFISKGTHTKETQAFKRQLRWDFEMFANKLTLMFSDMADSIDRGTRSMLAPDEIFSDIADRFRSASVLIEEHRAKITEARMREKGYGVYINKAGQAFSIFDDEITKAVEKDKEEIKTDEVL